VTTRVCKEIGMTLLLVAGISTGLLGLAAAGTFFLRRPAPRPQLEPAPVRLTHIRLLRSDLEISEAARRAGEREELLAQAAEQRAAHFAALMRATGVPAERLRCD
jgi:hypothetical protein